MEELVSIPKKEYEKLKNQSIAFQEIMKAFDQKNSKLATLIEEFKETDFYENAFLKDLELGLEKSNYFKYND